ncbi:MAG: MATE family efflux transporter [Balneolaceae bacterium]|nr:MATE family efflux transporter [Balneolaceae bacterium]MBO6545197.1 MATE family efflux transporter [Balneolaceae bacterium]MBO6646593.1 MATE family efflux transporter [Balneolaceae bacterium]
MNKQILRLAIPNIISNLSVPLLGAVDTAVVGHLEHVYYLGAIAVGSIIFDFIFWGFGFLRMGTTGLVAQAFGAGNERETRIILIRVLAVAGIASALILLLQYPLIEISLLMVNATPEVEEYTRLYYSIRIFAAPATLALFGINGWFLGMQNSTYPMLITIVLNLFNVGLNLLFVLYFGMNVDGVALGSLIASYLGVVVAIGMYLKKYSGIKLKASLQEVLDPTELKKFFSVNRDIFIRTLCLIFSYAFFVAKSAESGDVVLAANTILLQLWYISAYGIDGFAFAAESLVGRFKGANDVEKLKESVKLSMGWGLGFGIVATMIYALFGDSIITIFTDKADVLETGLVVIIWTVFAPVINSICFIWDGVYIGATATSAMRNSMLIATILFFVPVYYLAEPFVGVHALWLSMSLFMIIRGITLSFWARSQIFKPLSIQAIP